MLSSLALSSTAAGLPLPDQFSLHVSVSPTQATPGTQQVTWTITVDTDGRPLLTGTIIELTTQPGTQPAGCSPTCVEDATGATWFLPPQSGPLTLTATREYPGSGDIIGTADSPDPACTNCPQAATVLAPAPPTPAPTPGSPSPAPTTTPGASPSPIPVATPASATPAGTPSGGPTALGPTPAPPDSPKLVGTPQATGKGSSGPPDAGSASAPASAPESDEPTPSETASAKGTIDGGLFLPPAGAGDDTLWLSRLLLVGGAGFLAIAAYLLFRRRAAVTPALAAAAPMPALATAPATPPPPLAKTRSKPKPAARRATGRSTGSRPKKTTPRTTKPRTRRKPASS
ncbi:MAG TPA: hypothetical protein VIA02_10380 [Candidatus Limnocylindria bacterium]